MNKNDALELAMETLEHRIIDFMFNHFDNENMRLLIKEYNEAIDVLEGLKDANSG